MDKPYQTVSARCLDPGSPVSQQANVAVKLRSRQAEGADPREPLSPRKPLSPRGELKPR